nr:calmodulin-like protein 9 [Ipomoea batatas]
MVDPATISVIVSIIATLAATAKTVVETLEKKRGNGWKANAEYAKVLAEFRSMIGGSFPVFDGRNYKIWSMKLKNWLISNDLWDLVEEGYIEKGRNDKTSKNDREKDSLIIVIILLAVDDSVSRCAVDANSSKEVWDKIKTEYKGITHQFKFILVS